jgi:hypothetical protein
MKDLRHLFEYTFIGVYFGLLIFFFSNYSYNPISKVIFSLSLPLFYFLWGVVHHYFEDRLTFGVFMEYLSISIFVFIILITATVI